MVLEELVFDIRDIKVILKPELHKYHYNAAHDPSIGAVPATTEYRVGERIVRENCFLNYDTNKKAFVIPLSNFVPRDAKDVALLENHSQTMSAAARVYSILFEMGYYLDNLRPVIKTRNFYKNSNGEWRDVGDWNGVESHDELLNRADAVK